MGSNTHTTTHTADDSYKYHQTGVRSDNHNTILHVVECLLYGLVEINVNVFFFTNYQLPPGLPLPGWAEIRQWAYSTQIPLYKDGDTSPSLVLTGSLGLIDRSYRDREIGVSPVGPTLAAGWG